MPSFIETQFPTDISYGAVGGPMFSTDIITNYGGYEQRNANWSAPLREWNVAHGIKTTAQLNTLITFFHVMQGKATGFRFKDWSDYSATQQVIGTGDGVETDFQIIKKYTVASNTFTRTITKPLAAGLVVRVNEVVKTLTTDYTVSTTTGIITFISPPTNTHVIDCTFEFDVPARFNTDKMDISLDSYQIGSWANIPIMELRP